MRAIGVFFLLMLPLIASAETPATKPVDYYAISPAEFAKLDAASGRLSKDPKNGLDAALLDAAIFHATNEARVKNGLEPLKHLPALERSAVGHSEEMAKLGYFSHVSPVEKNKTFWQRIAAEGVRGVTAENILVRQTLGTKSGKVLVTIRNGKETRKDLETGKPVDMYTYTGAARDAVDALMNSPLHRENILGKFTHMGAGTARGPMGESKQDSFYVTQNFAKLAK